MLSKLDKLDKVEALIDYVTAMMRLLPPAPASLNWSRKMPYIGQGPAERIITLTNLKKPLRIARKQGLLLPVKPRPAGKGRGRGKEADADDKRYHEIVAQKKEERNTVHIRLERTTIC